MSRILVTFDILFQVFIAKLTEEKFSSLILTGEVTHVLKMQKVRDHLSIPFSFYLFSLSFCLGFNFVYFLFTYSIFLYKLFFG